MSRLITNLIGQKVNIVMEDGRLEWEILDVDGDWVYLERTDKKEIEQKNIFRLMLFTLLNV
ncbi:aspartyl-tRNA synthetase [Streptococcus orisratti]|uniref:aspartyl-tRNA synthetase n=1 Tax=Streptococcus orisratti TaxID=114652 RepID=UPI003D03DCFE